MADPFSVAGTAVGIISLGIQTCKGIVWYIDTAKDAKEKAERLRREVEQLTDILESLENTVTQAGLSSTSSTVTYAGISACASALEQIKERLGKRSSIGRSHIRTRLQTIKERLSYPFKEGELVYWKNALDHVQQHLQTALLALQIDLQRSYHKEVIHTISQEASLTRINYQSLEQQGKIFSDNHRHQLSIQTHAIQSLAEGSHQQAIGLDSRLQSLQQDMSSIAKDRESLNTLVSLLNRHINKVGDNDIDSFAPGPMQVNIRQHRILSRQIGRVNHTSCTCRSRPRKASYFRWPIDFSWDTRTGHDPGCLYTTFHPTVTDINLRFSLCGFGLRQKIHMSIAISRMALGSFSVNPALTCYRIVPWSSPAFEVIQIYWRSPERIPGELLKLFQDGKASPYDRLEDGITLLHLFSFWASNGMKVDASTVREVLELLQNVAFETDDNGNTCLDLAVCYRCDIGSTLEEILVDHGVQLSIRKASAVELQFLSKARFGYNYAELSTEPEALLAILMNSTQQLQHALDIDRNHGGYSNLDLYRLATILGRTECCELLLKNRFPVIGPKSILSDDQNLLVLSTYSETLSTLRFWLKVMEKATEDEVINVGELRSAMHSVGYDRQKHEMPMYMALLDNLICQRTELKAIADSHAIQLDCHADDGRLLDAHAYCAIQRLDNDCIHIPYHLRLNKESIYQLLGNNWNVDASHLEVVYTAGFLDLTAADFSCSYNESISVLLGLVTRHFSSQQALKIGPWMVSKGSSLHECWPKSDITVGHCLGWACGHQWEYEWNVHRPDMASLMLQTGIDGCLCACSSSGCAFISYLLKGLKSAFYSQREWRAGELSEDHLELVSIASQTVNGRGLISDLIRACAFSKLEIRHTCCDIERILHWGKPDLSKSPTPRYQARELQRIQKEDAYLVDILEKLVPELDAEYDNFEGDLKAFVREHLHPRLDDVLRDLKRQDRDLYAQGRRELGVLMEIGSGDEEEDEEVEEIDSVEESSDEDDW